MSGVIGAIQAPQPVRTPEVGQRPSVPFFPLRATPPVFRVIGSAGNVDMGAAQAKFVPPLLLPPSLLAPRRTAGARPSGLTIELDVAVASLGGVAGQIVRSVRSLATSLAGSGAVSANDVVTRSMGSGIASSSTVVADLAGGTLAGTLELTDETSTGLTLTAESPASETLTDEAPDSLTLTPA